MVDSKPIVKTRFLRFNLQERRTILIIGDFLVALISLIISLVIWASSEKFIGFSLEFIQRRVPAWFLFFPLVWLILLIELYDIRQATDWKAIVRGIAMAAITGFGIYLLLFFYYVDPPKSLLPRRGVASFLIVVSLLTLIWRLIYLRIFSNPKFMRRYLLVGGGKSGHLLLSSIGRLSPLPFNIIGVIDDDPEKANTEIEGYRVIGNSDSLMEIIEEQEITDVIVAITGEMMGKMFQALLVAHEAGVEVIRMPRVYEELLMRVPIRVLEADWILRSFVDDIRAKGFYELAKRLLDIMGGLIGLLAMLVILPFVGLAIVLESGRPIFYTQIRSGKRDARYNIYKFRTMRKDAEADGRPQWASEDDQRATRVGKYLRKSHLDELPQSINVLKGEMSLVGPRAERPELVSLFEKHVPFYRARLLVKPGMTGWAQVNFGYAATIDETITKLEYDLYYIKHRNIFIDLMIILRTPATVFGFRGR
ncbi:MAG: sugar transferase [Anaerolineales bacterium]|nr:sugar transferase [Anaerolineales bacterium]